MSFSRTNSLGWALYEILSSSQMNSLDIDHANAVDGAAGGQYTPSAQLDFRGNGGGSTGAVKFEEYPDIDSHTVYVGQPLTYPAKNVDFVISYSGVGHRPHWYQNSLAGSSHLLFHLPNTINKAQLTGVRALVHGNAQTAYSGLGNDIYASVTDDTFTEITASDVIGTDGSTTLGEMNAAHWITADLVGAGHTIVIDDSSPVSVWAWIYGVGGGSAQVGYRVLQLQAVFTVTRLTV